MKQRALLLSLVTALSMTPPVQAATSSNTFSVTATIALSCSISISPLNFGTYDPSAVADATATTTATVACTGPTNYSIAMNAGAGTGASFASRKMSGSTANLSYNLYSSSGHTTVWGDGTGGTATPGGLSILGSTTHTVYGKIPAGQVINAGNYADTVTVTLSY